MEVGYLPGLFLFGPSHAGVEHLHPALAWTLLVAWTIFFDQAIRLLCQGFAWMQFAAHTLDKGFVFVAAFLLIHLIKKWMDSKDRLMNEKMWPEPQEVRLLQLLSVCPTPTCLTSGLCLLTTAAKQAELKMRRERITLLAGPLV